MYSSSNVFRRVAPPATTALALWQASANEPKDESPKPTDFDHAKSEREDLPYRVELWDETKNRVEQVLAVTSHGSIGYAAYYAAAREYPDRYVTLRHKNSIITRWNGPGQ